jgi:hypothetical protein
MMMWSGLNWIRKGKEAGFCEHGNEPSGSMKAGNMLTSCATIRFPTKILTR